MKVRTYEVAAEARQESFSKNRDKLFDFFWESVESGGRKSALPFIFPGVQSMKAIPDLFGDSFHLFRSYVFDVLGIHEFGVTVSGKSRDHMDVGVWQVHSSAGREHPL